MKNCFRSSPKICKIELSFHINIQLTEKNVLSIVEFILELVYVTVGNPASCLVLYLTGVHFRGELERVGDVSEQKPSIDLSELER